jgi:DNA ligase OB-like domain
MGAIECVMASGKTFKIGSGFTDKQRQKPPKVGTIVVYKFQEYTKSMVPRYDCPQPSCVTSYSRPALPGSLLMLARRLTRPSLRMLFLAMLAMVTRLSNYSNPLVTLISSPCPVLVVYSRTNSF